jgi:hypothetical protein
MKRLLILPFLVLLTSCVTYYYPQTALQDGVYYAEDDPSYVVYSNSYAGVAYYPWSSLDYFYMGYYPYPRYGFGYGYGGGWSFGVSYGYSPWYYPYSNYGYYSPWYASYYHYPYYPARRPYRGYYSHYNRGHHKYGQLPGGPIAVTTHTITADITSTVNTITTGAIVEVGTTTATREMIIMIPVTVVQKMKTGMKILTNDVTRVANSMAIARPGLTAMYRLRLPGTPATGVW